MDEETLSVLQERAVPVGPTLRGVFDRSYRRLVVQMYGIVGDIHEAEDLVQEAFVRATAAGNRFLRVDNHEAWLRTTAVNLHRNRWRKLRNLAKIRHRLEQPTDLAGLDEHVAVVAALRTLPEAHRQVIALHYLADLPVAEVAETLGCAVGTVKSRL
jgi:RNA polymerase sigma-70 factor, ECF subfamily